MDYSSTNYYNNNTNSNNNNNTNNTNNSAKKNTNYSSTNSFNSNNNNNGSSQNLKINSNKANNNQRRARHYSSNHSQNQKKRFKHHYYYYNNSKSNNENNYSYSDECYSYYYNNNNNSPSWYYPQQKLKNRWLAPKQQLQQQPQQKPLNYDYNHLPNVVLQKIFGYLSLKDRLVASTTCSSWRQALYSPSLWQNASLTVYLCMRTDVESACYKMSSFARFVNGVIIKYSPFNEYLLNELDSLLEIVKSNRSLREITFYPIFDNYSAKTPNIERINKKMIASLKEIVANCVKLEHLSLGSYLVAEVSDVDQLDLESRHAHHMQSLHLCTIKSGLQNVARPRAKALRTTTQMQSSPPSAPCTGVNPRSSHLIETYLSQFSRLTHLSLNYEWLSEASLLQIASKQHFRSLTLNINEMISERNAISRDSWSAIKVANEHMELNLNVISLEEFGRRYHMILCDTMPLSRLRVFFSKCLNPDLLAYISDSFSGTLKTLCVMDQITDPTLRYHNPFRSDADPLVMLAWKCKKLEELILIGYEILEINLTAIAQLRNNLKLFHIPADCVITLRSGQFKNNYFIEDEDGNDTIVDYGICSNHVIEKVSKALGYTWHLLDKDELPVCVYDFDMSYEEAFLDIITNEQLPYSSF